MTPQYKIHCLWHGKLLDCCNHKGEKLMDLEEAGSRIVTLTHNHKLHGDNTAKYYIILA